MEPAASSGAEDVLVAPLSPSPHAGATAGAETEPQPVHTSGSGFSDYSSSAPRVTRLLVDDSPAADSHRRRASQQRASKRPTTSQSPAPHIVLRDLPPQKRLEEEPPRKSFAGPAGSPAISGGGNTMGDEVAEDSESLGSLNAAIGCNIAFTICGMVFVFANLVSSATAVIVSSFIYTKRAPLSRTLAFFTLLLGALSCMGGIASFIVAVWAISNNGFKRCMELWGVALAPSTYPIFAAYLVLSTMSLWRVRRDVSDRSRAALRRVSNLASTMRCYRILNHKVVAAPPEQAQIVVHIVPDARVRAEMVSEYEVDESVLTDALDSTQLARVEFRNGHVAAVVKLPHVYRAEDNHFFKVDSCGLFLFGNRLIVVLHDAFPLFEGRVFSSVDTLDDVVIRLMHRFTCCFEDHLRMINGCSEDLEREIELSTDNCKLMHLFTLEKSLVYHLNAINSNGRVISRMQTRLDLSPSNAALLEEVAVENAQCNKMATIYSQVISGLMDARASIISNNLNIMMKNLNSIVIAIAVPSFFAGVGGMSEFSAMIDFDKWWRVAYPLFIVIMAVIGVLVFMLLRYTESLWAGTKRAS